MQERRCVRAPDDPAAIADAYQRARALSRDLLTMREQIDLKNELAALDSLESQITAADRLDELARLTLYHQIRTVTRSMAGPTRVCETMSTGMNGAAARSGRLGHSRVTAAPTRVPC